MSNGGTAQGGAGGTVVVSSNGGGAGSAGNGIAGSAAIGGASGSDECSWDPVAIDTCPVCDGSSGCERPGYKYMGSGAITSSCCGLQWQEEAAPGKYTWSQANEYCASLSLLDLDWRLPKIAELDSLVLLGGEPSSAAIDVEVFADTLREAYWSSSLVGKTPQVAWCVNFSNGSSQSTDLDGLHRVRCVR